MIKIYGKVTDFDDNSVTNAKIEIKDKNFKTIYQTLSDIKGKYTLKLKKGTYTALTASRDYKTKNLEYWVWNVPAYQDLQINPRIGGLELYAMNGFIPQGAYPSLIIYFRPMSLKRFKEEEGNFKSKITIDIAPDLSKNDIELKINNEQVNILEINKIKEFAGNDQSIFAYLIQSELPADWKKAEYLYISLALIDSETNERGEGCLFYSYNSHQKDIITTKKCPFYYT